MSSYYNGAYQKRLNRYGYDYQSRVQAQREREFEGKLLKSVYRVDFEFENEWHPGTLEPYKQNETETLQHLLTRFDLDMPNGTILMISDKNSVSQPWMVFWLESSVARGYHRYVVLKMTHFIKWRDRNGQEQESWCYLYGQQDGNLRDEVMANRAKLIYAENSESHFFILPTNAALKRQDYFEIGEGDLKEAYRVTGYDIQSTPGVQYVTADPCYIRDQTPTPVQKDEDDAEKFYWLNGGVI